MAILCLRERRICADAAQSISCRRGLRRAESGSPGRCTAKGLAATRYSWGNIVGSDQRQLACYGEENANIELGKNRRLLDYSCGGGIVGRHVAGALDGSACKGVGCAEQ